MARAADQIACKMAGCLDGRTLRGALIERHPGKSAPQFTLDILTIVVKYSPGMILPTADPSRMSVPLPPQDTAARARIAGHAADELDGWTVPGDIGSPQAAAWLTA